MTDYVVLVLDLYYTGILDLYYTGILDLYYTGTLHGRLRGVGTGAGEHSVIHMTTSTHILCHIIIHTMSHHHT